MHGEVMRPDDEYKGVDGEHPEHQRQHGVCVVEEVGINGQALLSLSVWVD